MPYGRMTPACAMMQGTIFSRCRVVLSIEEKRSTTCKRVQVTLQECMCMAAASVGVLTGADHDMEL